MLGYKYYTEHCSVWSYQFYWYYYRQYADDSFTARMTVYALDEDFYGGRTGPLEKFYLFIYFLLI